MRMFFKKLNKYINKVNNKDDAPPFKYEGNTLTPETSHQIYMMYNQFITLQEMFEKESDYSRLLKRENDELKEELEYLYAETDEEEILSLTDEKEYIS